MPATLRWRCSPIHSTSRQNKPKYLADTPRFVTYIRATCSRYRELFPLLRLIDRIEGQANVSGYAFGRV